MAFVTEYDRWSQQGWPDPIPGALVAAVTEEMRTVLEDDQSWHLRGRVRQHGSIRVMETELEESTEDHAVVRVTLDATGVAVTAEGEETWVDYSKPIVTRFELEKDGRWRVAASASED